MQVEAFSPCKEWWGSVIDGKTSRAGRIESELAWKVPFAEIKERNFNLDLKNPHQEEVISHDPEVLLANYDKQQQDIQELRNQLKSILSNALAGNA